jgi:NADPH-dependent glutamate synthase beta subunit-like oxidoreductase/bacterioferritin-associated ferredoxin
MKVVVSNARFHPEKCAGCRTCAYVCPTMAYTLSLDRPLEKYKLAPCEFQCPIGNDIEGFISFISQKKYLDAYRLILKTNPFPGVTGRACPSPCEEQCHRIKFDQGISIQALERFVADRAMKEGYKAVKPKITQKATVGIIGAGPAGLSCAYHLAQFGYKVTLFEAENRLGGMLRFGIPEYRLPKKILEWEISKITSLNVEVRVNQRLGKNLRLGDLEPFDALFISTGLPRSRELMIPGEKSQGIYPALEFLRKVHSGRAISLGKRVAVIGGGNSAIDAARCARRLGSEPVILYRRSVEEMPALRSERQALQNEGIQILPFVMPKEIITHKGRVQKIECLRTHLGEMGKDGRQNPIPIEGSNFFLECDTVIVAAGELSDFSGLPASLKVKGDRLVVDSHGVTTRRRTFAGGDVATGEGTISEAIASGKHGATAIHRFLQKGAFRENGFKPEVVRFEELNPDYFNPAPRIDSGRLDPAQAVESFDETCLSYNEGEAFKEAQRCFGCAALPTYRPEDCRGCTNCEQRCPASAITIEPCERPYTVGVDPAEFEAAQISSLCLKAKIHPQQIVCYCTNTTAGEIAAAILKGANTPEAVSRLTGARTGCTVLCIQSIVKLLEASGQAVEPGATHQSYGKTFTVWDLDVRAKKKHEGRGYHFDGDIELIEKVFEKR